MTDKSTLLNKLKENYLQNFAAISAISSKDVSTILYYDEGVCFFVIDGYDEHGAAIGTNFVIHEKQETLNYFLEKIGENKEFFVANYDFKQWKNIKTKWTSVCHQFVYENAKIFPETEIDGISFSKLLPKDYSLAQETYTFGSSLSNEEFIEHIENGFSVAAYDKDTNLCGFIGTHSDGSMGMLEVLPAFRRHHIGEELEKRLINEILRDNKIPYCHVVYGNDKSFNLQVKLGGTCCEKLIVFLEIE